MDRESGLVLRVYTVDPRALGISNELPFIDLGGPEQACCDEVREIAIHHLDDVRRKIEDLTRLERLLASTVDQCSGGHATDCAVIDMLESS